MVKWLVNGIWLSPGRSKGNYLSVEPGGCSCIKRTRPQIVGRQGIHECRMDHCGPRRRAVWGLYPNRAAWRGTETSAKRAYSFEVYFRVKKVS